MLKPFFLKEPYKLPDDGQIHEDTAPSAKGDNMNKMIAACGIDCATCESYQATINNDNAHRERVAKEWSERYQNQLNIQDINCSGCRKEGIKFAWCLICPIRDCVISKGYNTCAECSELPCDFNRSLFEQAPEVWKNLQELK
jgi:hypothetical protein